jgi:hypothetical protein
MSDLMGYAHPNYAFSLKEFGEPRQWPRCGGWILVRDIPGTPYKDAMGCYPMFVCRDWSRLHEDLMAFDSDLVSLALVTDAFARIDQGYLSKCFHVVKPFKRHFVVDLSKDMELFVTKHHRYYARRALKELQVEIHENPIGHVDEWTNLYDNLVKRHNISGIRTFSKNSFRMQMETPGFILITGKLGGEVVGGHIIVIQDDVAYSHLAAFSDLGYREFASYGIYWITLKYLSEHKIRYFDLGAAAGIGENGEDGLSRFKAGWSNETRIAHFCGRIVDNNKYESLRRENNIDFNDYFPAYRKGEFY